MSGSDALPIVKASQWRRVLRVWDQAGMAFLYVCLFAACALFIPRFLSASNLAGLGQSIITVGIVACGMLFCLVSGDFDLSVGSVAAFSAVVGVMTINYLTPIDLAGVERGPWPMIGGMAAGLLAGALFGLVNGVLIAKVRINALITTLATMQIARGLAFIVSKHQSIGSLNVTYNKFFGVKTFAGLPTPIWLLVGCIAVSGVILHLTVFGRKTMAIGGNAVAARYSGINVAGVKILVFVLTGMLAGLAGMVDASQLQNADPKTYADLPLAAISACVLGGVSLTGGVGSIAAVVVGTLIMGTVQNAMNALGVDQDYQYLITGGILLAAVLYDRAKQRLMRGN